MCRLHVPVHPWCICPNPSALTPSATNTTPCAHHIWLLPYADNIPPTPLAPNLNRIFHIAPASALHRPAPAWVHCATYQAQHGIPTAAADPGLEAACPETKAAMAGARDGAEVRYPWDGLCSLCCTPYRGAALRLVRMRAAAGGGYEFPHGRSRELREPEIEARVMGSRAAREGGIRSGDGVFVDVVVDGEGGGAVDRERSAVYLFPGEGKGGVAIGTVTSLCKP
ncbi:hypothetical protein BT67DRAFT_431438 [Trichocladium antarcticum]|uniref:Uncharacterized protein n=1 Tax=Trichocladium antarcticum TaxID=1450529 RepID=A0AAN6UW71_9PEZI|nr:hypothetical protein BT67DRAFT_431438 [Trichocladium antarcticum]